MDKKRMHLKKIQEKLEMIREIEKEMEMEKKLKEEKMKMEEAKDEEIKKLKEELEKMRMERERMEAMFNRTQNFVGGFSAQLEAELDAAEARVQQLEEELREKNAGRGRPTTVQTVQAELAEVRQELGQVKKENRQLRKKEEESQDEMLRMRMRIAALERESAEKDAVLKMLTEGKN